MLKYQEEIAGYSCELSRFKELDRECFRWTFANIQDERNFLPIYVLNPKRKRVDCYGWALSFFVSQESARTRIEHLTEDKPQLYLKLGTHTAKGSLCILDGISDDEDEDGHFNHFEYRDIDLMPKFEIIECIFQSQDENA